MNCVAQTIAEFPSNLAFVQQHNTISLAWHDPIAKSALVKFITNGILKTTPKLAKCLIDCLDDISCSNLNDTETASYLAKLGKEIGSNLHFEFDELERISRRISQILTLLPDDYQAHSILDFGCGNAAIVSELGKHLDLSKENIHAVDQVKRRNIAADVSFGLVDEQSKTSLPNNSIELSLLLMTLHHSSEPLAILEEICRVLKPGAKLVIREHDADSVSCRLFLAAMDRLYFSFFNNQTALPMPNNYQPAEYWIELAKLAGLSIEQIDYPEPDSPMQPFHMVLSKSAQ